MTDAHTPPPHRDRREAAAWDRPRCRELRKATEDVAKQIAREEKRTDARMSRLREDRDRAMARLVGAGFSLSAAAEAGGLSPKSKSAAAAAARAYPEEVEAGARAVAEDGAEG